MESSITEQELIQEVARALVGVAEDPRGAMTGPELSEALGVSKPKVYSVLRTLVRLGKVETVRIRIVDLVGRETSTWGYRVVS